MHVIADISDATYKSKVGVISKYTKNGEKDALIELKKRSALGFFVIFFASSLVYLFFLVRPETAPDAVLYAISYGFLGYLIWRALGFKTLKKYSASNDIALCNVENVYFEETINKTSVTKSATRALLAGAAGSAWKHNKGFTSGLLTSVASSISPSTEESKVTEYTKVEIFFLDGVSIEGKTTRRIAEALYDASIFSSKDEFQRFIRMKEDIQRVLREMDEKIESLQKKRLKALNQSKNGSSFDERDVANKEVEVINSLLKKEERLKKNLERSCSEEQDEKYHVTKVDLDYYCALFITGVSFIAILPL